MQDKKKRDIAAELLKFLKEEEEKKLRKRCTSCNKTCLATTEYFYRRKNLKSGLDSWCKDCKKKMG